MKLVIEIEMDNAAFDTGPEDEVGVILRNYCDNLLGFGDLDKVLRDTNGNTVGFAGVSYRADES